MNTQSSYPEWVEKFRSKGKEIKRIGEHYYLYERKTVYDHEKHRAKKVSGPYIGRITEDGLVKARKRADVKPVEVGYPVEYGADQLLELLGSDILDNLRQYYRDELAELIFVIGKIGVIEPSPLKRLGLVYDNSYDSVIHPTVNLNKNNLTAVLRELGENRAAQVGFMKLFIQGSEKIIFDGTRLVSYSEEMDLNRVGYNHCGINDPQINLLYCFSLSPMKMPLYFRANAGDKPDIVVIQNALKEAGITDAILIADKGFGSAADYRAYKKADLDYIIPLKRDDTSISYSSIIHKGIRAYTGVFVYHDRSIFYFIQQERAIEKKTGRPKTGERNYTIRKDMIVTYMDQTLKTKEISDYNKRMASGRASYTLQDFQDREPAMGTITLRTTVDLQPQALYETYKERELIEDANKAYKNVLEDTASWMQDDKAYQGWLFLNHISLMLYYRLYNPIKALGQTSVFSVEDVVAKMKRLTLQKINGQDILQTGTKIELEKMIRLYPAEVRKLLSIVPK